ncbi:MAG: hypothetical protein IJW98_00670 [Clostridia bacterium]|nr:hypothetical protein [Clostridia bacterium]
MVVTFFGHSDAPSSVETKLTTILIDLIENKGATTFYVGNNGNFDRIVQNTLRTLKSQYSQIDALVVLAYLPGKYTHAETPLDTIYPEGLENVPKRFAICKRNEWMIKQCDLVITFVNRDFGGAAQYTKNAEKRGKTILNLAT